MALTLRHEVLKLALREPFLIARSEPGAGRSVTTVVVELTDDRFPGVVGLGEGYPDRYYGETPETMSAVLPLLLEEVGEPDLSVAGLSAAGAAMDAAIAHHGAAKCALDIALHDLAAKVASNQAANGGQSVASFIRFSLAHLAVRLSRHIRM